MSDYTSYTRLDHSSGEGVRCLDRDAVGREFSKYGGSYHGDGSEFIVGYDADGGAMVDAEAVTAAARRKSEELEESRKAEVALATMIRQQSAANAKSYLYRGRDIIWYRFAGTINGHHLLHKDPRCPYIFDSAKLGPFPSWQEGMIRLLGSREVGYTVPCPLCLRLKDKEDAEDRQRMDFIMSALRSGKWQLEHYTLDHPSPPPKKTPEKGAPAPAGPENRVETVIRKRFNMPSPGIIKTDDFYAVTMLPKRIVCQLRLLSPIPLDTSACLLLNCTLRITCHADKKPLFGKSRDLVVLEGNPVNKGAQIWEYEKHPSGMHAYIARFDYEKWELMDRPRAGQYSIDLTVTADHMAGAFRVHKEGHAAPTRELILLKP